MGQLSKTRVAILIFLLLCTSAVVYWEPPVAAERTQPPLEQMLTGINGWKNKGYSFLDPEIVNELELDDYINHYFSDGDNLVSLYIGYYYSTKKVGASHSPLVCFPGQGWVLSDKQVEKISVQGKDIHLARMIAKQGPSKELIIYWFQSLGFTAPDTFRQKIYTLWGKYVQKKENNAFVRVSVPMENISTAEAFSIGQNFIKAFYPSFYRQVVGAKNQSGQAGTSSDGISNSG